MSDSRQFASELDDERLTENRTQLPLMLMMEAQVGRGRKLGLQV